MWTASMEYLKSAGNSHEYELLPHNMTLYPVIYDKHIWYHCNIVGQRTDASQPSPPTVFFVELKLGYSYDVMGCTPIDHNIYRDCKSCPPSCSIMRPMKEKFICGSKEGQQLFHYSIPGKPLSFGPSYNGASTVPVTAIPKTSEGAKSD
ncbi:hypothetical protein EJB05_20940 [Eragrostis curvula]|uniref:DUF3615 domain-containing protein n=1 Tax=Eragrostis curvula TaxID=38414 RepID=A0A5J9V0E6_9POAL|nr:hypothetical protein EJB05_20940 [Eragrostis curvula]